VRDNNKPMLINGEWREGREYFEVRNPYEGSLLRKVSLSSKLDVEDAVLSAKKAFAIMAELPAHKRSAILTNTSRLIESKKKEIAELITGESGKAIKYSTAEVERSIQTFQFAAEEAKQIHGETVPMDASPNSEKRFAFYQPFPIGIIGAITPFNFPLNLVAHKVAPALAAGNSVVLKPSSYTPLTSIRLAEIMMEAGLPKGALNIVFGGGSTVGEWIVENENLAMISFTGSPPVGKRIKERAGMKRVALELGSNSASVIEPDADIDRAIPRCIIGAFSNAGQSCISLQRIYIHEKVFDEFKGKFIGAVKKIKVGNPMETDTEYGPMIEEKEAVRAEEWIKEAVDRGAKVLCGGERKGGIIAPTVMTDVKRDMKVVCNEVFAPLVTLIQYREFEDALDMVNDSRYGLQAGIFTKDIHKAFESFKRLHVGGVIINDVPTFRVEHMPYGGVKESGSGREGVKFAIKEMMELKLMVFNL
jgi:acyl-CoA reductase-like NAD-dependent aldehyde dehydrogenase